MRILLVQTSFLGDLVLSTPVIAALRKRHPTAELWLLTTLAGRELLKGDPRLTGIITFDKGSSEGGILQLLKKAAELRSQKFDIVYSLHKSFRTAILLYLSRIPKRIGFSQSKFSFLYTDRRPRLSSGHDVQKNLSILGPTAQLEEDDFRLSLTRPDESTCRAVLDKFNLVTPFAVIAPGSVWPTKRWQADGFRDVVSWVERELGYRAVVIGAGNEREVSEQVARETAAINICGETTLQDLLVIISTASLVVCNDSMNLHLASAFKIPTVTVFCATSPTFGFGPWQNPRASVVERSDLPCKPCARHGGRVCPTGTELCMKGLPSSQVIEAIGRVIR